MRAAALLAAAIFGGCSPSADDVIARKHEDIARLRAMQRDLDADAIERRAQFQADAVRYRDEPAIAAELAQAYHESAALSASIDADQKRDLEAAIARTQAELTRLRQSKP